MRSKEKKGAGARSTDGRLDSTRSLPGGGDAPASASSMPQRTSLAPKVDLRKEYNRYCKLYSSEPLDIVAGPLEKASYLDQAELDLKGKGLRGVDCIALGKLLVNNASICHLNLSDCLLLPQGFQALLDGLGKNGHLRKLELRGNNIQTLMVENLSTFMKQNSSVTHLLLEWNCLGSSRQAFQGFCDALALNKGIEYLDLKNNQITDEEGVDLAGALTQNETLKSLDLRWNSVGILGARALWDAVQSNQILTGMELAGNFVPEEIVQHIQSTLKQRTEKEAIIEEYSTRTNILTNQLQKTEESYKSEIKNILTVFEDEEAGLKGKLLAFKEEIEKLTQERLDEKKAKDILQLELNQLSENLNNSEQKEAALEDIIKAKGARISKLEEAVRLQADELEMKYDEKMSQTMKTVEALHVENDKLRAELQVANAKIKEQESQIQVLESRIETLKSFLQSSIKKSGDLFEERIRQEKANWTNWKNEVATSEQIEAQKIHSQLQELQHEMQQHIKVLESKKAEADEEVNSMKMVLLTAKTEHEESLSKLRNALRDEHAMSTKALQDQVETLKHLSESQEVECKRLDAHIRKLESELGSSQRQNEQLKQQNTNLEEDLQEVRERNQITLQKIRNEIKECNESMSTEQQTNKALRGEILELQEQNVLLTMHLSRSEKEKKSDADFWSGQIQRRDAELSRLKEEDMRRAALLHDAFTVYMRSTSAATGLPIPSTSGVGVIDGPRNQSVATVSPQQVNFTGTNPYMQSKGEHEHDHQPKGILPDCGKGDTH